MLDSGAPVAERAADLRESQLTIALPRLDRSTAGQRGITIADFLVPIQVGERISARARHVALIVAGALFIALTANFAVPVPGSPVPLTGQTFSVLLVGGALGAMAIGNVIIYVFGIPWLVASTGMTLQAAINAGLVPFVITDLIKLVLAAGAFPLAWWVVGRRPGEG